MTEALIVSDTPDPALALRLSLPTDRHPAWVYLSGLTSEQSQRTMHAALRKIIALVAPDHTIESFPWAALRYPHTQRIRALLAQSEKPATANKCLAALRGVLKEAWRLGEVSAEDYARAADVQNVRGSSVPAGRDLDGGEILALSRVCMDDDSPAGARDAAIIGMLATCGMRRAELVALDLADFDPTTGRLLLRHTKGRKERTAYVRGGTLMALLDWLALRCAAAGPLFVPITRTGALQPRRMSAQAVYDLLKRRGAAAGLADFSPHDFRRTFVGDLLERGVDLATVAELAGHATVETTRHYDRRPDQVRAEAVGRLHFPYQRRMR